MAPRFGGYLSQLHLWGSCLQPSPRCQGADQDVPAPRIFTGTSNSARPKPNSPPASAGSPRLWGGKSPSSELGGPTYKHSLCDLTKAALGGCRNVWGNNDKCPGGHWTHSRLLRSGAALSAPHATPGRKGSVFLAFDQSVPTHMFLTPVCIQVTAHSQASCPVTAQRPPGRLQPLPALQLFRVTQLSLFWVLCSCVTCILRVWEQQVWGRGAQARPPVAAMLAPHFPASPSVRWVLQSHLRLNVIVFTKCSHQAGHVGRATSIFPCEVKTTVVSPAAVTAARGRGSYRPCRIPALTTVTGFQKFPGTIS